MTRPRTEGHKVALNPSAPWSDKARKPAPNAERKTAVLYVIAREGSRLCKMGRTTSLKERLLTLQQDTKWQLHVQFWAEVDADKVAAVEKQALRLVYPNATIRMPEWRVVAPDVAARAIIDAAQAEGVRIIAMAGFPAAYDPEPNEVQEVLAEPVTFMDRRGRLERELWAPHDQSMRY